MGPEELVQALRGLRREKPKLDIAPGCAFGVVVEERLKELDRNIQEIKSRLNALFFLVMGAVVVEVVLRLMR